jgi:hypothetical protein
LHKRELAPPGIKLWSELFTTDQRKGSELPDISDPKVPLKQDPQGELEVVALDLRRVGKTGSAVLGSFTAWVPSHDVRYYEVLWGQKTNGEEWIMLPRRQWTDRDGNTRYAKLIAFGSDKSDRAFQRGVAGGP